MSKLLFLTLWDATLTPCSLCPGPSEGWLLAFDFMLFPRFSVQLDKELSDRKALHWVKINKELLVMQAGSTSKRKMHFQHDAEQPCSTGLVCSSWGQLSTGICSGTSYNSLKTAFLNPMTSVKIGPGQRLYIPVVRARRWPRSGDPECFHSMPSKTSS